MKHYSVQFFSGLFFFVLLGLANVTLMEMSAHNRLIRVFPRGTPSETPLLFALFEVFLCSVFMVVAMKLPISRNARGLLIFLLLLATGVLILYNLHVFVDILYVA